MHLAFKAFDGRSVNCIPVTDQDTGNEIGYIQSEGVGFGGGIVVSLFDGKYRTTVNRYEECIGFVRGVQVVLNHMTWVEPRPAKAQHPTVAARSDSIGK